MGSPKKSQLTRQRVLSVTSELFRKVGYQTTSMRDIAAAAGMKSGSLYYYYESKEALLAAILNDNIDATISCLQEAVAALPADATVREKFYAAVKAAVKTIADAGDMALASARTLSYLQEPEFSEQVRHRQAYNQFWRDLIEEGIKNGEIKPSTSVAMVTMVIVGALAFVGEWYDAERATTDAIGEIFADLFFEGLHQTR